MKGKKAIAMPFNWIFAIIVGGIILFLAIYGAVKIIGIGEQVSYTESAAKLIVLLDPLETGLASGKSGEINFQKDTRTFYTCEERDNRPFGKQTIAFSEKTIGNEYGEKGQEVSVKSKYVFAENIVEGKDLYLFSKPFFMGFKIADIIMISSKDYCFFQAPNEIKDEIGNLSLGNIKFEDSDLNNCTSDKVCFFKNSECDIEVLLDERYVDKKDKRVYFIDSLVFGAIFSSSEIYECNVQRLINKFNELVLIYKDKIKIISEKGCSSNIINDLEFIRNSNMTSSRDLIVLEEQIKNINTLNSAATSGCKLF